VAPLSPASKQQLVYELIRERIVEGAYLPGHRIVLDAIIRELKVSPMPVREAIRRLEAEGWVDYKRHQGATVSRRDVTSWASEMATLAVLEGYATALGSRTFDADDYRELRDLNERMRNAIQHLDVPAVVELDGRFHHYLFDHCPNPHTRAVVTWSGEQLGALREGLLHRVPPRGMVAVEEHEQLVAMLEAEEHPREIEHFLRHHRLNDVAWVEQHQPALRHPVGPASADTA
jgi:DNA-binding GntR family transcriptional regulator